MSRGTVPPNNFFDGGTVPPNNFFDGGTVPSNNFFGGGTVPPNSHFLEGRSLTSLSMMGIAIKNNDYITVVMITIIVIMIIDYCNARAE